MVFWFENKIMSKYLQSKEFSSLIYKQNKDSTRGVQKSLRKSAAKFVIVMRNLRSLCML